MTIEPCATPAHTMRTRSKSRPLPGGQPARVAGWLCALLLLGCGASDDPKTSAAPAPPAESVSERLEEEARHSPSMSPDARVDTFETLLADPQRAGRHPVEVGVEPLASLVLGRADELGLIT